MVRVTDMCPLKRDVPLREVQLYCDHKFQFSGNSDNLANDTEMLSTTNVETFPDKAEMNENVIPMASLSAVELLEIRREKINAKKVLITSLVSAILEDPNTNVS